MYGKYRLLLLGKCNVVHILHKSLFAFFIVSFCSTNAYWTRDDSGDVKKYSIGYFYSLSKRTTLYGQLAYSDFEDKAVAEFFRGKGFENDSVTGVQVGINHKF